jgi:hypothetical protein
VSQFRFAFDSTLFGVIRGAVERMTKNEHAPSLNAAERCCSKSVRRQAALSCDVVESYTQVCHSCLAEVSSNRAQIAIVMHAL